MKLLKQLFAYAGKHKYLTIASLILSAVSALVFLAPFIYIWKILEEILSVYPNYNQAVHAAEYAWMAFGFSIAGILIYVGSLLCSHLAAFRIANNMRKKAMHHVTKLPMGYLETQGSGKIRKTIDEASASTETYLAHQLPDTVQLMTTAIAVFVLLFIFDWRFGLASLIPLGLGLYQMSKMTGKGLEGSMRNYMDALDAMSNEAVEYVRGIPVVKTFQQTIYSFHRFHEAIKNYEKFAIGYTLQMRQPLTWFNTFLNSIYIFIIGAMMLFILNGFQLTNLWLDFLFYVIFTPILAVTANKIMFSSENAMLAKDALMRIESITKLDPFAYAKDPQKIEGSDIEFRHVSFHYPDSQEMVLKDISLSIPAGKTVAFVGVSGSGKSTLVSLIPRFYDVSEGSVLIGGKDVRQYSEDDLMDHVAFVFQNGHLLKRSIRDNIKMGYPASEEAILKALHLAQCDDIIAALPKGIDTEIGTEGTYVSGGEAQRLLVARAILKDAPIILLDEASAFADPDNEVKMQQALLELSKGKTTVMIAHRLSTIQNTDCIYVMDQGKIIESGSHDALIAQGGAYANMWVQYQSSVEWKIAGEEEKK